MNAIFNTHASNRLTSNCNVRQAGYVVHICEWPANIGVSLRMGIRSITWVGVVLTASVNARECTHPCTNLLYQ